MRKLLFTLMLLALGATSITAQKIEWQSDFKAKVTSASTVTYLDLAKKIFPDAQLDEKQASTVNATESVPLRHLFEKWEAESYKGKLSIGVEELTQTVNGNEKLLWLIFSSVNSAGSKEEFCSDCSKYILAAFRLSANDAEMIDAANILTEYNDRAGFWEEKSKVEIKPRYESVVIANTASLGISSDNFSIVSVNQKGFNVLVNAFSISRDTNCGFGYEEELRLRLIKSAGGEFRTIEMTVTTSSYEESDEEEESNKVYKPRFSRKFRYLFVWKPQDQKYKAMTNPKLLDKKREAIYRKLKPRDA